MRADWLDFLTQRGAVLGSDEISDFGDPRQELRIATQGDIVCDLSQHGLIAAQGADSATFLQGQFTNDVRQITPEHSQLSAYCNPKGRILACFRLFQRGAVYYLRMPQERVEPTLKRLRIFVLRAQLSLENASHELVRIGLAGPNAEALLHKALSATPAEVDQVSQTQGITVIRLPAAVQPRFEIYGELGSIKELWTELSAQLKPVGAEAWRLLDILAGIPTIYKNTAEAFIPQMVNLQLINGVSFRKGCYTGQEIVARTHYLGKLKRRMYRAHVDSSSLPSPGDELFSPQSQADQRVGKLVDACRHPDGGYELLAVVTVDCAETGRVFLGDGTRAALEFRPLPYPLDSTVSSVKRDN